VVDYNRFGAVPLVPLVPWYQVLFYTKKIHKKKKEMKK